MDEFIKEAIAQKIPKDLEKVATAIIPPTRQTRSIGGSLPEHGR